MSWPLVPLLNCCSVSTGKHDANHGEVNGCYPFYTCADKPIRANTFSFDGDSIILPGNGANVGLVLFYSGKFEAYQRTYVLNKFVESVDSRYVYHHLNRYWKLRNERTQFGSATNYIRMQNFEDYEIPLPPLAEQQRIAAILDKADAIRRKRQQAIQLADDFLRAVFLDMFGDPVTNPKGLTITSLGKLCDVTSGGTPSRLVDEYYGGEIPWVKTTEVNGCVIFSTEECLSNEGLNNSNCKLNPIGSIVLAMYGQGKTRGKVGMLGVESATNQACAVIKPSSNVMREYLYIYLQLSYELLRSLGQGAGQPNLNLSIVKAFPVPLPSENEQRRFVNVSEYIKGVKNKNTDASEKSVGFFNSLSQKAFSGKL